MPLGLYTQWIGTLISTWMHKKKATSMQTTNTAFQMAMMVSLWTSTIKKTGKLGNATKLDPYITIMQIIGSVSSTFSTLFSRIKIKANNRLLYRHQQ